MIEAVIFDWAGTTVDYGCMAPVQAFREAFGHFEIPVTMEETRKPMGMLKIDHIRTMLKMERIAGLWNDKFGSPADEKDVNAVYDQFEPKLLSILDQYSQPKPYVIETVKKLREQGIKIGSTTGYTDKMMEIVVPKAKALGYDPDFWISPDSVGGAGRPYPYMIFENLKKFNIRSVRNAVKIGDTVSDIKEGLNAGVWSAGVIEGSSVLGFSQDEFESLSAEDKKREIERTRKTFTDAGADFVLSDLSELPDLVRMIG